MDSTGSDELGSLCWVVADVPRLWKGSAKLPDLSGEDFDQDTTVLTGAAAVSLSIQLVQMGQIFCLLLLLLLPPQLLLPMCYGDDDDDVFHT